VNFLSGRGSGTGPLGALAEFHELVAGLLGHPDPVEWAVNPRQVARRRSRSITANADEGP
jgi:hypothetical protein